MEWVDDTTEDVFGHWIFPHLRINNIFHTVMTHEKDGLTVLECGTCGVIVTVPVQREKENEPCTPATPAGYSK